MIKLTLLRQLLQRNWYQMYWVSFPLEHTSNAEGDPDAWAAQVLHIICPGLHPGEDTPASPHGVDITREAAVTNYTLYCLIGIEQGVRGCFRRWERSSDFTGQLPPASSWAAPSQIGAVLPQFVCLIGCMRLMDNTRKQIVIIPPYKTKTQSPSTQAGHLECKDHDNWSIR